MAETSAHQYTSGLEHFFVRSTVSKLCTWHSWSASWSFITNHDDGFDTPFKLASFHGLDHSDLTVENFSYTFEHCSFMSGDLGHGPSRREVPIQELKMSSFLNGIR